MADNARNVATPHGKLCNSHHIFASHIVHRLSGFCSSALYAIVDTGYTWHRDSSLTRVLSHSRRSVTTEECYTDCTINNRQACTIRRPVARHHNLQSQPAPAPAPTFQRHDVFWLRQPLPPIFFCFGLQISLVNVRIWLWPRDDSKLVTYLSYST